MKKWIQLDYINNSQEVASERDVLEFFFDGDVDILDANQKDFKNKYRILARRPEEKQIKLGRGSRAVYPSCEHLQVRVNVNGIRSQMNAVQALKQIPNTDNKPLIDLLLDRQTISWPRFSLKNIESINWKILTDPNFEGCDKQREFVTKGLNTTDFAILDGPPGTGKTTTILELIVQLVRQGKRVLLTASTHAAINNVLERVKENELENEIFSLRIGDEARAQGVEEFQYDNQLDGLHHATGVNDLDQLLVDSSNLVCGTTMGILRLINNNKVSLEKGHAPFDVMIIDECSKTTFAEFLVPARFAKRWILVGDIKQLSPFTDREQIIANLKELILRPKTSKNKNELKLSAAVQDACFLLNFLRKNVSGRWGYHDKLIMPVSSALLAALVDEINARSKSDSAYLTIGLIGKKHHNEIKQYFSPSKLKEMPWLLYEHSLIFIDHSLLETTQNILPHDAAIIDDSWRQSSHCFRHQALWDNEHHVTLKRSKDLTSSSEVHSTVTDELKNNSWADEIVWRLEREYWLRFINSTGRNPAAGIKRQLEQLLPRSVNATGRIYTVRDMAFPSILEALSGSGILKSNKEQPNTLNQGFNNKEKECRHTTLTYQHRMHPDISNYSRNQFYSEQGKTHSLLDGSKTNRRWSYEHYTKRAIWLNVDGGQQRGNKNPAEAVKIIKELQCFCEWAENQEKEYEVAVLTFYKGQEAQLRSEIQKLTNNKNARSRFHYKGVQIKLNTVDYFQGQEADVVFLSMVNTERDGFMDSPNRLNVAVTRARFQLIVVGKYDYYAHKSPSPDLKTLAHSLFKES
ncbi:AAA domain-containing protein [Psychromonas sp. KJ10-2]|uniref:AAA domain-containing protein n=1 Tax=Psychromonas sp. KJ10-2 TaxID=3391822 RepID=UPI0039B56EB7